MGTAAIAGVITRVKSLGLREEGDTRGGKPDPAAGSTACSPTPRAARSV